MAYSANVINVMIASPTDVEKERDSIREIIHEWNAINAEDRNLVLMPLGWESHASPRMGDTAQGVINQQVLAHCDVLVACFWTRLGSPTEESPSGTVEEIKKHLEAGKPAMLYFSNTPAKPDSVNNEQYRALQNFRSECKKRGLVESYESMEEFREKFTRQLAQTVLREFPGPAPENREKTKRKTEQGFPELSGDAKQLLIEASHDPNGQIIHLRSSLGLAVQTNRKNFVQGMDPRSEATWKAALAELVHVGLLEAVGRKGNVFQITDAGYKLADHFSKNR
jgi:hypothetical protein